MPENSVLLNLATEISKQLTGSRLSPQIARLYSQQTRLKSGQPGLRSWVTSETYERANDAETLITIALLKRDQTPADTSWRIDMRRAAEIYEWLTPLSGELSEIPIVLLASAAYQLSGFPARALGVLKSEELLRNEQRIISSFLTADFKSMFSHLTHYWARKSSLLLDDIGSEEIDTTLVDEIVRSIGVLSAWMSWGSDGRLQKALSKLKLSSQLMIFGARPYSWLLSRLIAEIANEYVETSLRTVVRPLAEAGNTLKRDAIEQYVRSAFENSTVLSWPSQREGILAVRKGHSFALCTPTGSGKTRVAELAIIDALMKDHSSKDALDGLPVGLYLVPSKALAAEVERSLQKSFSRISSARINVTSLYGGSDWGVSDAFLATDRMSIVISTYEKADALSRFLGTNFRNRIRIVIVDEAHSLEYMGDGEDLKDMTSRSLRLESLLGRLMSELPESQCKVVALSAVAAGMDQQLARWVSGDNSANAITSYYRSTRQLVGHLLCKADSSVEVQFDVLDGQRLRVKGMISGEGPYIPNPYRAHPSTAPLRFNGPEKGLRPYLFWAAMNFSARDSTGQHHSVLISVPQNPGAYADDFLALLDGPWATVERPIFFNELDKDQADILKRCLSSCEDYFGSSSREYRLLQKGIVLHHGKMPGQMARLLIELVRNRVANIVIATSTLTEGINLPFEVVLIASLRRSQRYLSIREFGNLIGRSGRPGVSTEGRTLVLMGQGAYSGTREAYRQLIEELTQHSTTGMNSISDRGALARLMEYIQVYWKILVPNGTGLQFDQWLENTICDKEVNAVEALDTLDGILLGVIEEYGEAHPEPIAKSELEANLIKFWRHTFSHYSSSREAELQRWVVLRGVALARQIYPDKDTRRRIYRTGVSPREAKVIFTNMDEIKGIMLTAKDYNSWQISERIKFLGSLVEILQAVPSFRLKSIPRNVEWTDLLHWWLSPGTANAVPDAKHVSDWYEACSQNFGYRFSWGIGSIISIAIDSDDPNASSFEGWEKTGLPWVIFWLKDLMNWGTTDPVVVYLLIEGIAASRPEALKMAVKYYSASILATGDAKYDPRMIAKWAREKLTEQPSGSQIALQGGNFPVELSADVKIYPSNEIYVLPIVKNQRIEWIDPAGFLLARSNKPSDWHELSRENFEYTLMADKSEIWAHRYLQS